MTDFLQTGRMAHAFHGDSIPQASTGILVRVTGDRAYSLPSGPGHGVEPHPDVFNHVVAA